MRMVYQLVGGRQVWRGKGVDREYPLAELARKQHRGPKPIGDLMIPLLIRLGVAIEEEPKEIESNTSEARSSA